MPFFINHRRLSFTLIEALISISIIAILSTIMFGAYANDKDRGTVKYAADLLTTQIQSMQTNAISNVVLTGTSTVPSGYGIAISQDTNTLTEPDCPDHTHYFEYADVAPANGVGNNNYDCHDSHRLDKTLADYYLPSQVQVIKIWGIKNDSTLVQDIPSVDITFATLDGGVTFKEASGGIAYDNVASFYIQLKHITLNLCYQIVVTKAGAQSFVTKRQLTTCS